MNADAEPVNAEASELTEFVWRKVVGICFERDFRAAHQREMITDGLHDKRQFIGREQRRSAPSEVKRLDGFTAEVCFLYFDLADQRVDQLGAAR